VKNFVVLNYSNGVPLLRKKTLKTNAGISDCRFKILDLIGSWNLPFGIYKKLPLMKIQSLSHLMNVDSTIL